MIVGKSLPILVLSFLFCEMRDFNPRTSTVSSMCNLLMFCWSVTPGSGQRLSLSFLARPWLHTSGCEVPLLCERRWWLLPLASSQGYGKDTDRGGRPGWWYLWRGGIQHLLCGSLLPVAICCCVSAEELRRQVVLTGLFIAGATASLPHRNTGNVLPPQGTPSSKVAGGSWWKRGIL